MIGRAAIKQPEAHALPLLRHIQAMQISGIHAPFSDSTWLSDDGTPAYRLFRLIVRSKCFPERHVPFKLPILTRNETTYSFFDGRLHQDGEELLVANASFARATLPPEEHPWHLKGYTLPFEGTEVPYRELRLNLRLTGRCPGKCRFCHRWHSHRVKTDERRRPLRDSIIERLISDEGEDVLDKVERVVVICELFGREDSFLQAVKECRREVLAYGYPENKPFGCCAQDVRSERGLERLRSLLVPARYSYTLELFENRHRMMGAYKGIGIERVYKILENAKRVGFDEIQLNYLAGIDSLPVCERGFEELSRRGLVDSIGLSTFVAFSSAQASYRHPSAHNPDYYSELVSLLKSRSITSYRPESFDMDTPYTVMLERTG